MESENMFQQIVLSVGTMLCCLTTGETNDYSGNHSLIIYVMFAPGHGYVPEYSSYGMLDDFRVFSYDSNSRDFSSPLKQHASLTSVWRDLGDCTAFKTGYFQSFTRRANATLGLNSPLLQLMYGCELDHDGSQRGVYKFSVNGKHTLSLDEDSILWTASVPNAMALAVKSTLDGYELWNHSNLLYMKRDCVPRLKKLYAHSMTIINRKVRPVGVIRARAGEAGVIVCLVTGFYPREVSVEWELDGETTSEHVTTTEVLPNHDHTYQVQKTILVSGSSHNYSCRVEHSSLPQPLLIYWVPPDAPTAHTTVALATVGVLVMVITAVVIWHKRRSLCC